MVTTLGRNLILAVPLILPLLLLACGRETPPHASATGPPADEMKCTLYASPKGSDQFSGISPDFPKTLRGAAAATRPGSVLCLMAGTYPLASTFYPPVSGTPAAWIVYKNYAGGDVNLVWAGARDAPDKMMIKMGTGKRPWGPAYLEFRGLKLDGAQQALAGFFCFGSHHLRFIGNSITNTGGAGISTVLCDYVSSDRNVIYRNGYTSGWTSGISYNSSQWFDSYDGFHNVISNNIVAGEYDGSDKHTDGNGIILDLSNRTYEPGSANTPPALIVNNVVYGNGGRCIHAYLVSNFLVANNTCYKNGLDLKMDFPPSLSVHNSKDGYFVNNVVVAWNGKNAAFAQVGENANVRYVRNLVAGSRNNFPPSDPLQFMEADPLFVSPPQFDAELDGQYATAPAPAHLKDGLALQEASPARRRGVDPATLPDLPAVIREDLKKHIYTDINGHPRPAGGPFDLGAYQWTRGR